MESRGHLKNGNSPGNPALSPRCGAKRRNGQLCQAPAMWSSRTGKYTRCRLHGGASTGPTTTEGVESCGRSNWKHGRRSRATIEKRRRLRDEGRRLAKEAEKLLVSADDLPSFSTTDRHTRIMMLLRLQNRLDSLLEECRSARQYCLLGRFDRVDTKLLTSLGTLAGWL